MEYWRAKPVQELEFFYFPKEKIAFFLDEEESLIAAKFPEGFGDLLNEYVEFNFTKISNSVDGDEADAEELEGDLRKPDSWEKPVLGEYDSHIIRSKLYDYLVNLRSRINRRRLILPGPKERRVGTEELMNLILDNPF